jgi:hypothetical protein
LDGNNTQINQIKERQQYEIFENISSFDDKDVCNYKDVLQTSNHEFQYRQLEILSNDL